MVAGHLVEEPELDPVADAEAPVDRLVLGARLAVDDLPAHVRRRRHPIDLDHVVFPLDPVSGGVAVAAVLMAVALMSVLVLLSAGSRDERCGQELHPAPQ